MNIEHNKRFADKNSEATQEQILAHDAWWLIGISRKLNNWIFIDPNNLRLRQTDNPESLRHAIATNLRLSLIELTPKA